MKQALGGKSNYFFPPHTHLRTPHFSHSEVRVRCCSCFSWRFFFFQNFCPTRLSHCYSPQCETHFPVCAFSFSSTRCSCLAAHTAQLAPGAHRVQLTVTGWLFVTQTELLRPKGHFVFQWVPPAYRELLKQVSAVHGSVLPLIRLWRCLLSWHAEHTFSTWRGEKKT